MSPFNINHRTHLLLRNSHTINPQIFQREPMA